MDKQNRTQILPNCAGLQQKLQTANMIVLLPPTCLGCQLHFEEKEQNYTWPSLRNNNRKWIRVPRGDKEACLHKQKHWKAVRLIFNTPKTHQQRTFYPNNPHVSSTGAIHSHGSWQNKTLQTAWDNSRCMPLVPGLAGSSRGKHVRY